MRFFPWPQLLHPSCCLSIPALTTNQSSKTIIFLFWLQRPQRRDIERVTLARLILPSSSSDNHHSNTRHQGQISRDKLLESDRWVRVRVVTCCLRCCGQYHRVQSNCLEEDRTLSHYGVVSPTSYNGANGIPVCSLHDNSCLSPWVCVCVLVRSGNGYVPVFVILQIIGCLVFPPNFCKCFCWIKNSLSTMRKNSCKKAKLSLSPSSLEAVH